MSPKERMLTLRLLRKAAECPAYANSLGLEAAILKLEEEDKLSEHRAASRGT